MDELFRMAVIQYGFAGLSIILLSFIFWLVRQLIMLLKENNKVISENTAAINNLTKNSNDQLKLQRDISDKLLSRPCIARGE